MNYSQICQIKDFKILCAHGFEVEFFLEGNHRKYCYYNIIVTVTIIIMQHHLGWKETFISNKPKYFRKICFGWGVVCFTKPLICSDSLLPKPGAVFHFPPPH